MENKRFTEPTPQQESAMDGKMQDSEKLLSAERAKLLAELVQKYGEDTVSEGVDTFKTNGFKLRGHEITIFDSNGDTRIDRVVLYGTEQRRFMDKYGVLWDGLRDLVRLSKKVDRSDYMTHISQRGEAKEELLKELGVGE